MKQRFALAFLFSGISTLAAAAQPPARGPAGYTVGLEDLGIDNFLKIERVLPAKGVTPVAPDGQSAQFRNAMAIWPSQAKLSISSGGVAASYSWSFGIH